MFEIIPIEMGTSIVNWNMGDFSAPWCGLECGPIQFTLRVRG